MFDFGWSKEDHQKTEKYVDGAKSLAAGLLGGAIILVLFTLLGSKPTSATHDVAPPQTLLIRGQDWQVVIIPQGALLSDPDVIGQTLCGARVIQLVDTIHGFRQRENLLHELFHASVCKWTPKEGWSPENSIYNQEPWDATAHPAIYAAEQNLIPILQDNPDLATYLGSHDPR